MLVERDEGGAGPNESVFATDFLKETLPRKPLFHVQKTTLFITNLVLNNGQFNISKLCGHWLECFQDDFPFPFSRYVIFFSLANIFNQNDLGPTARFPYKAKSRN